MALLAAACSGGSAGHSAAGAPSSSTSPAAQQPAAAASPSPAVAAAPLSCRPTPADQLGPFYKPGAPVRDQVDAGFVLAGTVQTWDGCRPIQGARLEFWLANPQGDYDDAHRATVLGGADGTYRFTCNRPVAYGGRPPHIHVRVTAPGRDAFVTQFYPAPGQNQATFDIVL